MLGEVPDRSPLLLAFGAIVRETRTGRDVSQEQLALDAELSRDYVGRIERGTSNPTIEVVQRIAAALETQGSSLLAAAEKDATG